MSPWGQGRATVDQMLASGQQERVPPNREAADALLDRASTHLLSAAILAASDVELAYDSLHVRSRPDGPLRPQTPIVGKPAGTAK